MTDREANARNDLRLEEYKVLKAEISTLDARVERGISTVLGINALVLTVIYLDIVPGLRIIDIDPDRLRSVELPLFGALFLLNAVLGSRYYFMTKHIEKIGGYIARLEQEIYRKTPQPLGWELSMRGDAPVDIKKHNTRIDTFRRMIFWVFVAMVNLAVLLDMIYSLISEG